MNFREVCETLGWFNPSGKPSTGLVYKIAYVPDYEPGREVRQRLGMRDQCSKCRRPFHKPKPPRPKRQLSEARRKFNALTYESQEKLLEWALTQIEEL
jgi:hypothetical protein